MRTVRILALVSLMLALAFSPLNAEVIVYQGDDGLHHGVGGAEQVFPDLSGYDIFQFDDFSTTQPYLVTTYTAFGMESGNPAFNREVRGEIWSAMPDRGGLLLLSGSGVQMGENLLIDFQHQYLAPGSYWIVPYVVRPFSGGGQWYINGTLPVHGSEHWFYNPGGAFGRGTASFPASEQFGQGGYVDHAFRLEGVPVPEPGGITLVVCGAIAGLIWWRRRR